MHYEIDISMILSAGTILSFSCEAYMIKKAARTFSIEIIDYLQEGGCSQLLSAGGKNQASHENKGVGVHYSLSGILMHCTILTSTLKCRVV